MKRKRSFYKKTFRRRGGGKKRFANSKVARVGAVKRMIKRSEETKWVSNQNALVPWADGYTTNALLFTGIQRGGDRNNRIGNRITLTSLFMNVVAQPAATALISTPLRFMLLYGKDAPCKLVGATAGDYPGMADPVAQSELFPPLVPTNQYFLAPHNPNYVPAKYKILMDKLVKIDILGGSTNIFSMLLMRKKFKLKSTIVYNDSNLGNPQDSVKNALWLLVFCPSATALAAPTLNVDWRLSYKDA
ncbi:capsid protein [robinz virus RP_244]|nr:capsid protein [robinz virus RP_244]